MQVDEVPLIRASRLLAEGFAHGFSTRAGGVSEGAFESLNLARTVGDEAALVAENSRRFSHALGVSTRNVYEVSQVHGRALVEVERHDDVAATRLLEADALLTRHPGLAVAVRTADCVPVLLANRSSGAVAAVHAGWRGVTARIVEGALARLGDAKDICATIGPHIRAFEVGDDVAAQIDEVSHGATVVEARDPRPHVDLAAALCAQLEHGGVHDIEDVGGCTLSEGARFFSYRRDAGVTGRHLSAIVARG
ncbi:MAG: peptidoglycan editing factor PgeF [Sandaracinaceae bacterium]